MCTWIDSEKDSKGNSIHSVTNSISWGNFSNTTGNAQYDIDGTTKISGVKQTTGKSEYWKAKNIYDFAGNTWEWTAEKRIDDDYLSHYIIRGSSYAHNGSDMPTSYRDNYTSSFVYFTLAFRIVLYVM